MGRIVETVQNQHLAARQQRADQLERRVLRCRTDQSHRAVFNDRQKGILLGAVEAVDFVDEQHGAVPGLAALARAIENFAQICNAGKHRAQRFELQIRMARQQPRDGGFPAAGRPPQNMRSKPSRGDHAPDHAFSTQQVILADHLIQLTRAHALRQGTRGIFFE